MSCIARKTHRLELARKEEKEKEKEEEEEVIVK